MKRNSLNLITAALIIFGATSTFASTQTSFHPMIINGRPVQLGENYSQHTVGVGDSSLFCTGVLIDKHHILTAAHCEDGLLHGRIFFGTSDANFEYRNVVEVTVHPNYCMNDNCGSDDSVDDFDILVAKFEGDIPYGFTPVAVAARADLVSGVKIHLAGFGANEFGRYEDILKVTEVPMDTVHGNTEFKTVETAAGSCYGDSGGPAYIEKDNNLQVAGLTSRGDGPCRAFGIYTMVDYFSSWISGIVQKP